MSGLGYAIFVQGGSKPVAVRVNNFDDVGLVEKVIRHVRYLSSVVVDDRIVVVSNGEVYGAMPGNTAGHLSAIIAAYPNHQKMDDILMMPPMDDGGLPMPIHISSKDIPADDEKTSLIPVRSGGGGINGWKVLEAAFVIAMVMMIIGLMVACIVVHMTSDD